MSGYHLAQINVGRPLRAAVSDPLIAGFVAELDRINAIADTAPGFVWRLKGAGNNATDIHPDATDPLMALNMSVWESPQAAAAPFVYRSDHLPVMRRRAEWFEKMEISHGAVVGPPGSHANDQEGLSRLDVLRRRGPTPEAFTLQGYLPGPGPQPAAPACPG